MNFLARLNLHTRISLVLTGLAASLLLVLAAIWLHGARTGIHEEVEAASRVSEQWLSALTVEMQTVPAAVLTDRVLGIVKPLGRIRANALEVFCCRWPAALSLTATDLQGWTFRAGLVHWFAGPDISTAHPSGQ
jgi:hypothetical protein